MNLDALEIFMLGVNLFNVFAVLLKIGAVIAVIALAIHYFKNRKNREK